MSRLQISDSDRLEPGILQPPRDGARVKGSASLEKSRFYNTSRT